jgi:proline iminopeptidase
MLRRWHFLLLPALLAGCLDPGGPGSLVPKTVDEDPSLSSIEVSDTKLHAEAFGDPAAPMIMMLHGGPGNDYRQLLPMQALADDGYYVVLWDQRGAGLSRRHDGASYTLDGYLEDLRLVIEHFSSSDTQPIVFIGHSWGAMYATWFINEYGDYHGRVAGAVLSEPGAFTKDEMVDYMSTFWPPWGWTSEELNDIMWTDQQLSKGDHERADYLMLVSGLAGLPRQHNTPENPAPMWRLGAVVNARLSNLAMQGGFDWTTRLREFAHPVLFLRGELNEDMPLEHQQKLASHYAQAQIITVPGTGHDAIWDRSDEFLSHVRVYLKEVLP